MGGADVLLDAAHNPDGARALAGYLAEIGWRDVTLVFAAMQDKDAGRCSRSSRPLQRRHLHGGENPRAFPADALALRERVPGAGP